MRNVTSALFALMLTSPAYAGMALDPTTATSDNLVGSVWQDVMPGKGNGYPVNSAGALIPPTFPTPAAGYSACSFEGFAGPTGGPHGGQLRIGNYVSSLTSRGLYITGQWWHFTRIFGNAGGETLHFQIDSLGGPMGVIADLNTGNGIADIYVPTIYGRLGASAPWQYVSTPSNPVILRETVRNYKEVRGTPGSVSFDLDIHDISSDGYPFLAWGYGAETPVACTIHISLNTVNYAVMR